jgi:hypothetical protein
MDVIEQVWQHCWLASHCHGALSFAADRLLTTVHRSLPISGGDRKHFFTTPTGYLYAKESKEWKRRFDRVRAVFAIIYYRIVLL